MKVVGWVFMAIVLSIFLSALGLTAELNTMGGSMNYTADRQTLQTVQGYLVAKAVIATNSQSTLDYISSAKAAQEMEINLPALEKARAEEAQTSTSVEVQRLSHKAELLKVDVDLEIKEWQTASTVREAEIAINRIQKKLDAKVTSVALTPPTWLEKYVWDARPKYAVWLAGQMRLKSELALQNK